MRLIKLTGRESTVIRAMGFTEAQIGTDLQDNTRMELDDLTDTLNALIAAGFVESVPYCEEVQVAEVPVTAFEVNPAYAHELRRAASKR